MTEPVATTSSPQTEMTAEPRKGPKAAATAPQPVAAESAGPRESPQQKSWRERREQLGLIVDTLVHGDPSDPSSPMKRQGAALMASHIGIDDPRAHKGLPKSKPAPEMTPKMVLEYAAIFRSRYPGAWGAANRCDVANFMRFLGLAGLRGWQADEEKGEESDITVEEMIVHYQGGMSQLA
jgi:hypothetical protein